MRSASPAASRSPLAACAAVATRLDLLARRPAPRLEVRELAGDLLHRLHERRGLLLIERDLLLPPLVLQLALVRFRAQAVGLGFGLGQLDAHALEIALDLGQARRRDLLALAHRGERFARRADGLGQPLVALREEQLLPPAQLAAQPLVAAGLAGLPLERGALALELVDEIVDAGEVLLRRFELELGLAAARLELGDAGRFLDQLAAIGRLRAEDLADLALLDDGVALHADADVHQDVLHVAQADGVAVDQVLALAGAIEAAADLDVAGNRRRRLGAVTLPIHAVGGVSPSRPGSVPACFGRATTPRRWSRTSAAAVALRASLPPKITSSIRSPRRLLALCSPSTQVMASTMLLLPQPFGPTMAVTPVSNRTSARSGKLLKPESSSRSRRMEDRSVAAAAYWGNRLERLLDIGLGTRFCGAGDGLARRFPRGNRRQLYLSALAWRLAAVRRVRPSASPNRLSAYCACGSTATRCRRASSIENRAASIS